MTGRRSILRQMVGLVGLVAISQSGCTAGGRSTADSELQSSKIMKLSSAAFTANGAIPAKYTCDGSKVSPALSWDAPPAGTKSLALLVDDPDAPGKTFVHWVLYDLPPDLRQLPEDVAPQPLLSKGGTHGKNDFNRYGFGAPCPPSGTHRYVFKLYALDKLLDLPPGVKKADVEAAMQGHILANAELIGKYGR